MDDEVKARLQELLDRDKTKAEAVKFKADVEAEAAEKFVQDFLVVRDDIVIPAMQEISDFISGQGWGCDITPSGELRSGKGGTEAAKVTMTFYRGSQPNHQIGRDQPRFTASCDKRAKCVSFHSSTIGPNHGGSSGSAGTMKLSEIDAGSVQSKVTEYFAKLLKDAAPFPR